MTDTLTCIYDLPLYIHKCYTCEHTKEHPKAHPKYICVTTIIYTFAMYVRMYNSIYLRGLVKHLIYKILRRSWLKRCWNIDCDIKKRRKWETSGAEKYRIGSQHRLHKSSVDEFIQRGQPLR